MLGYWAILRFTDGGAGHTAPRPFTFHGADAAIAFTYHFASFLDDFDDIFKASRT